MAERRLLLDVNVLVALAWPTHQFHERAVARLESRPLPRWATTAITQLGFVRISCNPQVVGQALAPASALALIVDLTADSMHDYLESLPALGSAEAHLRRIVGHQQVTDAYLLQVAEAHGCVLLSFDRRLEAIATGRRRVEILG